MVKYMLFDIFLLIINRGKTTSGEYATVFVLQRYARLCHLIYC